jgi:hypothetical protein
MISYKLQKNNFGDDCSVLRSDGWSIPFDENNSDYIAYLAWCAEGNTPLPAEENT